MMVVTFSFSSRYRSSSVRGRTSRPSAVPSAWAMMVRSPGAAVALNVSDLLGRIGQYDMDLLLQLAERPDGSLFANLNLVGPGKWTVPADTGVTLRFSRSDRTEVRPSVTPTAGEFMIGVLGVWNDDGYWTIPYTEEGTYFLLQ